MQHRRLLAHSVRGTKCYKIRSYSPKPDMGWRPI
jgi:hypothetical protein